MMELSIEARRTAPSRFVDVSYYDLQNDPVNELRRIYRCADITFDDADAQAVENAARENTQHRYGKHVYRVEDFGLAGESVEQCFPSIVANTGAP